MLVLPWHWDGTKGVWQTAAKNGNPFEAGVWAIPAGKSLPDAQKVAANRLHGLDGILNEASPHLQACAAHLQVNGDGSWRAALDLGNDGTVDVVADSAQAGALPHPFPGLDEASGLLVSCRPFATTTAGKVGRVTMPISWRHPAAETPAICDRRPLNVSIPASSLVSPALVEGYAWSATQSVTIAAPTLEAEAQPVSRLGPTLFYAQVPLLPTGETLCTVSQSGTPATVVTGPIRWALCNLYDQPSVTLISGSSLRLGFDSPYGRRKTPP